MVNGLKPIRLYLTLAPAERHILPDELRGDLGRFLLQFPPDADGWPGIQAAVKELPDPQQVIDQLRANFAL